MAEALKDLSKEEQPVEKQAVLDLLDAERLSSVEEQVLAMLREHLQNPNECSVVRIDTKQVTFKIRATSTRDRVLIEVQRR